AGASDKEGVTGALKWDMPTAAMAWEIDGASDASKIAKHAIQAVNRLVCRFMPMAKDYLDTGNFRREIRRPASAWRCTACRPALGLPMFGVGMAGISIPFKGSK